MQINTEKNTNRKYYRIELPAKVSLDNVVYDAKDWSLGGFMLINLPAPIPTDWEGTVKMLLPFDRVEIAVEATAKVAWVRGDQAGFYFLELSPRAKGILKSYLKASIEGSLGELDGVLAYVDAPEIQLPTEMPLSAEEEKIFKRRFYKRSTVYWIVAILALGLMGVVLYFNLTTAISVRAVTDIPRVNVNAPIFGMLSSVPVKEGQSVNRGQILAIITPTAAYVSASAGVAGSASAGGGPSATTDVLNLTKDVSLPSPCSGTVYLCKLATGSGVRQGENLFIIHPDRNSPIRVLAAFTFQEAKGIAPGAAADVFIPSLGRWTTGTVENLGKQAVGEVEPSTDNMSTSVAEVPVSIVLDDPSLKLDNGLAVEVNIRTPIQARLGKVL